MTGFEDFALAWTSTMSWNFFRGVKASVFYVDLHDIPTNMRVIMFQNWWSEVNREKRKIFLAFFNQNYHC